MQNLKTKIKNIARERLPSNAYSFFYKSFKHISNLKSKYINKNSVVLDQKRLDLDTSFTQADFYDFGLDEINFKIFLNPSNGGVDYEIHANQNFEPGILNLFKTELKRQDVFLDVGANIGQHSMYASYFAKRVISFEPIKRLYDQFNNSVFMNNIFNIQIFNYALGDKKEELAIYSNDINMGASSILVSENRSVEQVIKVLRLDDEYENMNMEKVDFVKIDVEGYELNVLMGMQEIIKKYKPKILVEFTPFFYNKVDVSISRRLYDFLVENKYDIWDVGNLGEKYIKVENFEQIKYLDQTNLFCKTKLVN